jgi:hypothetical protein
MNTLTEILPTANSMNIQINITNGGIREDAVRAALQIIWDNHYDGASATFDSPSIQEVHEILYPLITK